MILVVLDDVKPGSENIQAAHCLELHYMNEWLKLDLHVQYLLGIDANGS